MKFQAFFSYIGGVEEINQGLATNSLCSNSYGMVLNVNGIREMSSVITYSNSTARVLVFSNRALVFLTQVGKILIN